MNSIRASDGSIGGASLGSCSPSAVSPLGPVESSGDQSRPKGKGKGKGKKKGSWGRRAASADVTKLLPDGPMSVRRTASCLCQADTLSSSCCARTEVILVNVGDPMPHISLPERLLVGRPRGVDRALVRELNECVFQLHFLGGFTSSGCLDVNGAASSVGPSRINAFCTLCTCSNVRRRGGRGSSLKAPRWRGLRPLGVHLGIVGRHGCTCTVQKIASVLLSPSSPSLCLSLFLFFSLSLFLSVSLKMSLFVFYFVMYNKTLDLLP